MSKGLGHFSKYTQMANNHMKMLNIINHYENENSYHFITMQMATMEEKKNRK